MLQHFISFFPFFYLCLSTAFSFSHGTQKRSTNSADLNPSKNNGNVVYHKIDGTNLSLKLFLDGTVLDPTVLEGFLTSIASEANGFFHRRGHDYPMADDDSDPWQKQRTQESFDLFFSIISGPMSPPLVTWRECVYTIDGIFSILQDRPTELATHIEIRYDDTGELHGEAFLSMDNISDASASNSSDSRPSSLSCKRGCFSDTATN